MNPLDAEARQQARNFSAQLGQLSAGLPTTRPQENLPNRASSPLASRLHAILARLLPRTPAQEHAEKKLLANKFLVGG